MFTIKNHILLLLLFLTVTAVAQLPQQLNFRTLTEKDGLSNKKINSIAQDKNGIIWIGSYNGLNRYDGNRIKSFYADDAGNSFGEISFLHATEKGLWICTPSQVFYMQTTTESLRLIGNFINAAINNNQGIYNLIDHKFVYQLPTDEELQQPNFTLKTSFRRSPTKVGFNRLVSDKAGQLWSYYENKIVLLNKKDLKIEKEFQVGNSIIQNLFFDSHNRCWVATWGKGAYIFDPATGSSKQFDIEQNQLVVLGFNSWQQHNKNYIVLSSDNSLILVDEESLAYQKYSDNIRFRLNSTYTDKDNNLWLACEDALKLVSNRQDLFTVIPITTPAADKKASWVSGVYSIKETKDNFWISKRYLTGIFQYDKNWQLKNYFPYLGEKNPNSILNSSEAFDFLEKDGKTFITTELGMYILDKNFKKKLIIPERDSLQIPRLRNIDVVSDSTWWIRSYSNGIYIFNPESEKFVQHYEVLDNRQVQQPVHYLLITKKGDTFVTTYDGLYELNSNQKFSKIEIAGVPSSYMLGMAEDKNGIIWITSSNGIFAFNPVSRKLYKSFKDYNEMGFSLRITVDDYNNIWFNCQKGYWCWMQDKQQMLKFGYEMGLPENRMEAGFTKGLDGLIYAGANDAVVKFDPAYIRDYSVVAPAFITDVRTNQMRSTTREVNDSTQKLELSPGTYDLLINFSVTDYATPGNYELYYQLEPGNSHFSLAEKGSVNFSGLGYGKYKVTVKGKNNLTGSFSKPYFLSLHILPHWYQTILFKVFLALAIIAFVLFLFKRRVMKIRREAQFKQKIAESEMSVLRSQMNPHFIFNSLNSIENFIFQNEKRNASDYLIKFSKLIRTILDINQLHLISYKKDMEALSWYIDLEQIRFPGKFNIKIETDPLIQNGNYYVPPMIIQPFIENAIVHGIAHSKGLGHQINIKVAVEGDYLTYFIEDDGIGMQKSAAINKFNKPRYKSVGLQITKERIRLHNQSNEENNIQFMERQPTGTIVIVKIKIKNHDGTNSNSGR